MSNMKKRARRGRRVGKDGRSIGRGKFVKLDHYLLESPAYRSLTAAARSLLIEVRYRYNGSNNGKIGFSVREAAEAANVAKDTATKCFVDLIEKGFIRRRKDGSFNYKLGHASEYELTDENCGEKLPTKDFMRWVPKEKAGPKSGTRRS